MKTTWQRTSITSCSHSSRYALFCTCFSSLLSAAFKATDCTVTHCDVHHRAVLCTLNSITLLLSRSTSHPIPSNPTIVLFDRCSLSMRGYPYTSRERATLACTSHGAVTITAATHRFDLIRCLSNRTAWI